MQKSTVEIPKWIWRLKSREEYEALGILGEDYKAMIDENYDKRWTDFHENIGKSTVGFCATVLIFARVYLLSWTEVIDERYVLAHN